MTVGSAKVLVAMSGGVDSSVAAALLQDAGHETTGVFLCLSRAAESPGRSGACCSPQDGADARRVADILGIELITYPASGAFESIIDEFVAEYASGRTPNPCVLCNRRIKFGLLFDLADTCGARFVATGHYARIIEHNGRPAIASALWRPKDQSYALFGIDASRLGRVLFPIGEIASKARVRAIAEGLGLPVSAKRDSQEICFVPGNDYVSLLRTRAPEALRPGPIVNSCGEVLGRHDGYARYTIGQRRGLGIACGEPMYVTDIEASTATVTIGRSDELLCDGLTAADANWHCDVPAEFEANVKIRYNHGGAVGRVRITGADTFEVRFAAPVSAVAPGQAAVVYDGRRLLGGGWIREKLQAH